MLTILCEYLRNWFDECCEKYIGTITITGGVMTVGDRTITFQNGQYFRIVGSVSNDGVYRYPASDLYNETFDGAVWEMKIPNEVVDLSREIQDWQAKYGGINSPAMSPYNSESFAGYSYSKQTGGIGTDGSEAPNSWQTAYKSRLNMWRKL